MNHLRQVFRGFGVVINPLGLRHSYVRPSHGGFQRDVDKLQGDWQLVGAMLKKNAEIALDRYGESANNAAGADTRW